MMRMHGQSSRRRAFTLLEVVVSIGLFIVLLATMFAFYDTALADRDEGLEKSRHAQLARVVLDRMADEIRQAVAHVPSYGPGITGIEDLEYGPRIEVNTLTVPDKALSEVREITQKNLPGQFDLQNIQYSIAWDYENVDTNGNPVALGLARTVTRTFLRDVVVEDFEEQDQIEDAAAAFKRELYAPEIKFLELAYFDGNQWWKDWAVSTLPQMVRITIGFVPELPPGEEGDIVEEDFLNDPDRQEPLPPDQYSVVVRLRQADVFFGSRIVREASSFSESPGM